MFKKIKNYLFASDNDLQIDGIKKQAIELINISVNSADTKVLHKIIQDHTKCIKEANLCELCEYIYDETEFDFPILTLARNPNLTFMEHYQCYLSMFDWQGLENDYIENLLLNPRLDKQTRELIIEHFTQLLKFEMMPDIFQDILDHPDFKKSEIEFLLAKLNGEIFSKDIQLMYQSKFLM